MAAIPAATAAPVKIDPGKLQKSAIAIRLPAFATVMNKTVRTVLSEKDALRIKPRPPSIAAKEACQRFSLVRSAFLVTTSIIATLRA